MGVPTVMALLLGFAVAAGHMEETDPGSSAIHRHAEHSPALPHHPGHSPGHQHKNCILCQTLQAASPATLPTAFALVLPCGEAAEHATAAPANFRVPGSPAAYISRAPPSFG